MVVCSGPVCSPAPGAVAEREHEQLLPVLLTALEPRVLTRWDMQKYARDAYDAGIRYIGGCCGFQTYHTRALAEELAAERGLSPAASEKHGAWGSDLGMHTKPWVRARYAPLHWPPAAGRPAWGGATHSVFYGTF